MVGKSARLAVIPQQSTQNTANLLLQTYEKNQWTFFCCSTRASTLVFAITLLTQVPVQKFPFLFISLIPWLNSSMFVGVVTPHYQHCVVLITKCHKYSHSALISNQDKHWDTQIWGAVKVGCIQIKLSPVQWWNKQNFVMKLVYW